MKTERAFTPDEQARLNERAHDMSQAFMWCPVRTMKDKLRRVARKMLMFGVPIIVLVGIICWALVELGTGLSIAEKSMAVASVCIVGLLAELLMLAYFFVVKDEEAKASPPVFVFFDDKLYKVESTDDFSLSQIKKIPAGEIHALRQVLGEWAKGMTNEQIEAECHYLSAIKENEIGNATKGLALTVIEDIVDVDVDEDDDSKFIITYEDEYDDEIELTEDMSAFSDMYEWLVEQMMRD